MAEKSPVGALGQARIAGRIQSLRRVSSGGDTTFRTVFKLPALDAYSSPATVEVRSKERLGQVGDELSVLVNIGGYPRSYMTKNGDGDDAKVQTAENVLTFAGLQ